MASSARIDELRKKFEENPRRYFAPLANEYRKAGEIDRAISICREYLPQQPGHMSGHIVYGQALYEARQFEEAKTVFETALSLDPENLIALRHLGDIALIVGDSDGARGWYRRVLEADPRNEEIQAQLASLDHAASNAPTPAITPAIPTNPAGMPAIAQPPAPAAPAKPVTSSAPTVVMKAMAPPGAPVTATSPTAEIRLDEILPTAEPPAADAPTPGLATTSITESAIGVETNNPGGVPSAALEGLEATSAGGGTADVAMGGFSLDGLETTSLSAEPPPPAAPAAPLTDLDFDTPAAPPPPVPESRPSVATLELDIPAAPEALDLDLGALGAPEPPAHPAASYPTQVAAAPAPIPAAAADEGPLDLELSLPVAPVAAVARPVPAPPAAVPDAPSAPMAPSVEPIAAFVPAPLDFQEPALEAVPAPESGPFVTETMAELYLQQGHREEALRVYRALLEQRPADGALREKLARLEAAAPPGEGSVEVSPPAMASASGPTIRELLGAIAQRRPGYRVEIPHGNGVAPVVDAVAPDRGADAPGADLLGAGFGFPAPAEHDENAALALAMAFSVNGLSADEPLITGAPARPAATELSLETVFKAGDAPAPSNFSFDQFFSQRATAEHPSSGAPDAPAQESPAEVAKFTQWLEGLKRR